jgi:hypothetical protein
MLHQVYLRSEVLLLSICYTRHTSAARCSCSSRSSAPATCAGGDTRAGEAGDGEAGDGEAGDGEAGPTAEGGGDPSRAPLG